MALNPEQFNELLKTAGRSGKRTINGETFLRHDDLIDRGLSPYPKYSDAGTEAGWVAADGYGLSHTPTGGLRDTYTPDGKLLETVATHKEGVAMIRQHRAGEHDSQKPQEPYKPLGRPIGGWPKSDDSKS